MAQQLNAPTMWSPSVFYVPLAQFSFHSLSCVPQSEFYLFYDPGTGVTLNVPDLPLDVPDSYRPLNSSKNPLLIHKANVYAEVHSLPMFSHLANFLFPSTRHDWETF